MKINRLRLSIHQALIDGTYALNISCKARSKAKRYDLIKSICETSKANQKLIRDDLEGYVDESEGDYDLEELEYVY